MSDEPVGLGVYWCGLHQRINGFSDMEQQKKVNLQPCKGCEYRTPHCHAKCQSYADYLKELAKHKKRHLEESVINDYIRLAHRRVLKRRR